jgi:hypothetical protein
MQSGENSNGTLALADPVPHSNPAQEVISGMGLVTWGGTWVPWTPGFAAYRTAYQTTANFGRTTPPLSATDFDGHLRSLQLRLKATSESWAQKRAKICRVFQPIRALLSCCNRGSFFMLQNQQDLIS